MKSLKQLISLLVLFFFLASHAAFAGVSLPAGSEVQVPTLFSLQIPKNWGSVESFSSGQGPVIVHIQSAHGNYEAQQKITQILKYLKENYGFNNVLVEGSAFPLDAEVLNYIPESREATLEVGDRLARKALLKAPELFLMQDDEAEGYGIEELESYRSNLQSFREVLLQKEKTGRFMLEIERQIERLSAPLLNKTLRGFLKRLKAHQNQEIPPATWFEELSVHALRAGIDLKEPASQIEWPMLTRYFRILDMGKEINKKEVIAERQKFLNDIKKFTSAAEIRSVLLESSEAVFSGDSFETVVEKLVQFLPSDFNYRAYPNVSRLIGMRLLHDEIRSTALLVEEKRLTGKIIDSLCVDEEEKKLIAVLDGLQLLDKLFLLELMPQEYDLLTRREAELKPSVLTDAVMALMLTKEVHADPFTHMPEMDLLYEKALEFYRGAKQRDGIMIENTRKWLKNSGQEKAVVVTGGFHAQPFADAFSAAGSRYFLITPSLSGTQNRDDYLNAIFQGDWQKIKSSTVESSMIALGAQRRRAQMGARGAAWIKRVERQTVFAVSSQKTKMPLTLRSEARNPRNERVSGYLIDALGAISPEDGKQRLHPAVFGAISRRQAQRGPIYVPDADKERIWSEIAAAETAGEELSVSAPLRSVVFGSGQDVLPTQRLLMPTTPDSLSGLPSLIAFVHNSRTKVKLGLARNPEGEHVKDSILYINDRLNIKRWTKVPMNLTAVNLKTPEGQADAVAYILGNIFGLSGLRIEVIEEGIALSAGGGFENSNIYDLDIGLIGQILSYFIGREMPAAELISILIRTASNEFDDMTGGQGILAAYLGANRFYFYGGILGPDGQPVAPTAIFAVPQAPSLASLLNQNSMILQPGQEFVNGVPEERHDYTSRMMIDVTGINHPGALKKARRLLKLTGIIDEALKSRDLKAVQSAVDEYTNIRIWFQVEWLKLARFSGQPFYEIRRQDPFLNNLAPFNISHSRSPTPEDAPYLGGHYEILKMAREKYGLAVMPMGKGSFGSNWMLFGPPVAIEKFKAESGYTELTDAIARVETTGAGRRKIAGWMPSGVAETKKGEALIQVSPSLKARFQISEQLLSIPQIPDFSGRNPLQKKYPTRSSGQLPSLTPGQSTSVNDVRSSIKQKLESAGAFFDPLNLIYLEQMLRRRAGSLKVRNLGRPVKLSVEPGGDFHLLAEAGDSFIQQRYGQSELPAILGDPELLRFAAQTRVRYMNALGGHGSRTGRKEMLSMLLGVPIDEVKLGTKGTDIGIQIVFETPDGKPVRTFISIFEIQIRRLIQTIEERTFQSVDLRSLVNPESLNSVKSLLEKPFINFRDPLDPNPKTYSEALKQSGVDWLEPYVQANLPGRDVQTGLIASAETTPLRAGGTAYWFFKIIDELLGLPESTEPEVWMFVGGDNAAAPIPELVGHVIKNNFPVVQVNTTTTLFDRDAGRNGWLEAPDGTPIQEVVEPREIAAMPAAPLVYSAGQVGGFGREGKQTQNTNMYYINKPVLRKILNKLVEILGAQGREILFDYITPDFIMNSVEEDTEPMDGAFSSAVHHLNRFFVYDYKYDPRIDRGTRRRIAQILPSLGLKQLLYFVNIPEEMRTAWYFPVKNTFSAYLLTTNRFVFNTERNHFEDPENKLPLAAGNFYSPDPKYYEDVRRFYTSFGRASFKNTISLNVAGSFLLTKRPGIETTTVLYSRDRGTFEDPRVLLRSGEVPEEDVIFKGRVEMVDYRRGSVGLVEASQRAELFGPLNLRSPEMRRQIAELKEPGLRFDDGDRLVLEDVRIESRIGIAPDNTRYVKLSVEKLPAAEIRSEARKIEAQVSARISNGVKILTRNFRGGIMPLALHSVILLSGGAAELRTVLEKDFGIRSSVTSLISPLTARNALKQTLNLPPAEETVLTGHLLLDSDLLIRMAEESPRALFLLFTHAIKSNPEKTSDPLLAVAVKPGGEQKLFTVLSTALGHQNAASGAELEIARKLMDGFVRNESGDVFRLLTLQNGTEADGYVTEQRGGVAAWQDTPVFDHLQSAARFSMDANTHPGDWIYIAAAILLTEPAARLIREEMNPEIRALKLKQFVAEHLSGFESENGTMVLSYFDQLKAWIDGRRMIETRA